MFTSVERVLITKSKGYSGADLSHCTVSGCSAPYLMPVAIKSFCLMEVMTMNFIGENNSNHSTLEVCCLVDVF